MNKKVMSELEIVKEEKGLEISNAFQLIQNAVEQGRDLSVIEKLMDLQDRFEKKEAEKQFNEAFSEWQKEKPHIIHTKAVSFGSGTNSTKYGIAELDKAQHLVDPILSKTNLTYSWVRSQDHEGKTITITFVLKHIKGFSQSNTMTAPYDSSGSKNAIQSISSTETYLKRITFFAGLGLSAGEDNDGLSLMMGEKKKITNDNLNKAIDLIKKGKFSVVKLLKEYAITQEQEVIINLAFKE